MRGERNGVIAAVALFLLWSGVFVFRTSFVAIDGRRYFCLFDDAMVSMRYAWNLSHETGLVWNSGERVEGYTSLLMTLLMSAATALLDKVSAVVAVQVLGVATAVSVALVAARLVLLVFPRQSFSLFVCLGLLAYYPLAYWSLMGMEGGLLALLVTASVALAVTHGRDRRFTTLWVLGLVLAAAFLTRPDAVIFAIPVLLYVGREAGHDARRSTFAAIVIGYVLIVAAHTSFRLLYYGQPLPNTYYLKLTGIPLMDRISNGVGYLGAFLGSHALLLAGAAYGLIRDRRREIALLSSLPLVAVGYQAWVGGDPWPYWRILLPAVPAIVVLFVGSVGAALASRRSWTFVVLGVAVFAADRPFLSELLLVAPPFQVPDNARNVNKAIAIDALTTEEASVGGCWAGAIPYYTGRRAVDFLGKSDAHVARLAPDLSGSVGWAGMRSVPGHNKYDLHYSLQTLLPTWAERFRWGRQDLTDWGRDHYVRIEYQGMALDLRKGAPEVRWSAVTARAK